jgi:hypothetical protein
MSEMDEQEAVVFGKLKQLRDGLDDFNYKLGAINSAGRRMGSLCDETAAVCSADKAEALAVLAQSLRELGGTIGDILPGLLAIADGVSKDLRALELKNRKGTP